jgi:hypothetical protein
MTNSEFVFESGEAISVGIHGETDFLFHSGDPVPNTGKSKVVFESGVGLGQKQVLYVRPDDGSKKVYELNPEDGSVIRSGNLSFQPHGIGGDTDTVWVGEDENSNGKIYKLDAGDFSVIDSRTFSDDNIFGPTSLGGDSNRCFVSLNKVSGTQGRIIYILDEDLNVVSRFTSNKRINAIGGATGAIYTGIRLLDSNGDKTDNANLQRRDNTFTVQAETGSIPQGGNIPGAGGSSDRAYFSANPSSNDINIYDPDMNFVRTITSDIGYFEVGGM